MSDYAQIIDLKYFQKKYKLLMFRGEYDPMCATVSVSSDVPETATDLSEVVFSIQMLPNSTPPPKGGDVEPYFIIVPRESYLPIEVQKELTDLTFEIQELIRGLDGASCTKDWMSGRYAALINKIGWVPVEFSQIFEVYHEELDFKSVGQIELGKGRFASLV